MYTLARFLWSSEWEWAKQPRLVNGTAKRSNGIKYSHIITYLQAKGLLHLYCRNSPQSAKARARRRRKNQCDKLPKWRAFSSRPSASRDCFDYDTIGIHTQWFQLEESQTTLLEWVSAREELAHWVLAYQWREVAVPQWHRLPVLAEQLECHFWFRFVKALWAILGLESGPWNEKRLSRLSITTKER